MSFLEEILSSALANFSSVFLEFKLLTSRMNPFNVLYLLQKGKNYLYQSGFHSKGRSHLELF